LGERQLRMAALFDGDGEYEIGEFGFTSPVGRCWRCIR